MIWHDATPVVPVAASVQLPELPNEAVVGEDVKLTDPVGVLAPLDAVSVTVAVHDVALPVLTDAGEQATAVDVGSTAGLVWPTNPSPKESTATHNPTDGHATLVRDLLVSIVVVVGVPGEAGSNVTCCPTPSTAVHWLVDGHATPDRALVPSIVVGVGVPGEAGSNVTCCP